MTLELIEAMPPISANAPVMVVKRVSYGNDGDQHAIAEFQFGQDPSSSRGSRWLQQQQHE